MSQRLSLLVVVLGLIALLVALIRTHVGTTVRVANYVPSLCLVAMGLVTLALSPFEGPVATGTLFLLLGGILFVDAHFVRPFWRFRAYFGSVICFIAALDIMD